LNIWTESETRWLTTEAWDSCRGTLPDLTGQPCYAGLDLASTDDITAYVKVFPVEDKCYVVPHFFLPEETVRLARKKFQKQYASWRDLGLLTVTNGNATDYGAVRAQILEDAQQYAVKMVGFDAWQALDTYQQLDMAGIPCVKIPQTFSGLHFGVKSVEEAVLDQTLVHDGNPVLRWMLGCTVIEQDGQGNRKPSKRKSQGDNGQKGKIDGVAAMVMAFSQITNIEQEAWVSVLG
jgi:phage terminase large subunit-like protein